MKNLPYKLIWIRDFFNESGKLTVFCPTAENALLKARLLENESSIHRVEVWRDNFRLFLSVK